jgi:FixJ family two-component response regulator
MVYLIDDEPIVRDAVADVLESYSMQVLSFESADRYLSHQRFDSASCLVLDLQLPGLNGLDLQDRLRDATTPPIIFISGRADIPSAARAMKAGAIDFLTKPIDTPTLIGAINEGFARDRVMREQCAEVQSLKERHLRLSPREREVMPLVVAGLLNKQAAALLGISEVTLQIHRSQIMRKMAARSFADLVRMASKLGIHTLDTLKCFKSMIYREIPFTLTKNSRLTALRKAGDHSRSPHRACADWSLPTSK